MATNRLTVDRRSFRGLRWQHLLLVAWIHNSYELCIRCLAMDISIRPSRQHVTISIYPSLYRSIYIFVAFTCSTGRPWKASFHFLNLRHLVGLLGRVISASQGRYVYRTTQIQNKCRKIPKSQVGFERTIPVFERVKTVHALDHAAAGIGDRSAISLGSSKRILYPP
jgi:hypothetical protein